MGHLNCCCHSSLHFDVEGHLMFDDELQTVNINDSKDLVLHHIILSRPLGWLQACSGEIIKIVHWSSSLSLVEDLHRPQDVRGVSRLQRALAILLWSSRSVQVLGVLFSVQHHDGLWWCAGGEDSLCHHSWHRSSRNNGDHHSIKIQN